MADARFLLDRSLGGRLLVTRLREAGWELTQDQLAVLSEIDSSNIRSYESGRSMLGMLTLVRIAEALHAQPGEFLEGLTSEMFVSERAKRTAS